MFFFGIFWFFFDSALVPLSDLGDVWSPLGYILVNPFGVPLLNSCILLSSAVTVTWSHHNLLSNNESSFGLFLTIVLALYFLLIQFLEYKDSLFRISDGVFGSVFYLSTGFHGMHVFFGILFLLFNFFRMLKIEFSFNHHLGYEFGIVY